MLWFMGSRSQPPLPFSEDRPAPCQSDRATLTVPEAAELLGIGRNLAYQLAREGELAGVPVIRVGHRIVVPAARLQAVLGLDRPTATGTEGAGKAGI